MSELWGVLGEGTVTFTRRYATTAADLWAALTEPERVARWLGPLEGDLRVGGVYRLRMGDDDAQTASGEILACDAAAGRLAVAWSFPGEAPSRVDVQVREHDDGQYNRPLPRADVEPVSTPYPPASRPARQDVDDELARLKREMGG